MSLMIGVFAEGDSDRRALSEGDNETSLAVYVELKLLALLLFPVAVPVTVDDEGCAAGPPVTPFVDPDAPPRALFGVEDKRVLGLELFFALLVTLFVTLDRRFEDTGADAPLALRIMMK